MPVTERLQLGVCPTVEDPITDIAICRVRRRFGVIPSRFDLVDKCVFILNSIALDILASSLKLLLKT